MTSPLDQAQINPLGGRSRRISTTSETRPLSEGTDFTVAVPGGFVRQVDAGVFRAETPEFIGRFKFDCAVISVSGIDSAGDIGDDDHAEVAAVQAAMRQSERIVLAVDNSKFGRRALVKLSGLTGIHELVCDAEPDVPLRALLDQAAVQVTVAT